MSKLLPILFVAILAAVVGGMDFYMQKQKHPGQVFGLTEYMASRQLAIAAYSRPPSLANAMPEQLAGWKVHRFQAEDLAILAGRPPTQQESEWFIDSRGQENFGKLLTKGVETVDLALYKGDIGLRLSGVYLAADGGLPTQALQAQAAFMKAIEDADAAAPPLEFAVVDGVTFQELAPGENDDPALRRFRATLTDAITITAVTRSTDDAVIAEALSAVDFVMLNSLLNDPLPNITDSAASTASADAVDGAGSAEEPGALSKIMQKVGGSQEVAAAGSSAEASQKACVRRAGKLDCPKN